MNRKQQALAGGLCVVALAVVLVGSGTVHKLLHKAEQEPQNAVSSAFDRQEWAARMGNPQAMRETAADLFGHWKQTQDEQAMQEAVKLWLAAAEKGDAESQAVVGILYDEGLGLQQDAEKAVKWYRKAAEQDNASAQYNLALCLHLGTGTEKNESEAVVWFQRAAEQGDREAQYYLGLCHDFGYGVPQNHREAVKWYLRAAEQGEPMAQYNLAYSYELGEGVEQDREKARGWYAKAAAQGDEKARKALQEMEEESSEYEKAPDDWSGAESDSE